MKHDRSIMHAPYAIHTISLTVSAKFWV